MFAHLGTFCAFIFPTGKKHFCNNLFYKWIWSQCYSTPLSFALFCPPSVLWSFFLPVLIRIGVISVNDKKKTSLERGKMKEQLLMQRLREPHGWVLDSSPQLRDFWRGCVFIAACNRRALSGAWRVVCEHSFCPAPRAQNCFLISQGKLGQEPAGARALVHDPPSLFCTWASVEVAPPPPDPISPEILIHMWLPWYICGCPGLVSMAELLLHWQNRCVWGKGGDFSIIMAAWHGG